MVQPRTSWWVAAVAVAGCASSSRTAGYGAHQRYGSSGSGVAEAQGAPGYGAQVLPSQSYQTQSVDVAPRPSAQGVAPGYLPSRPPAVAPPPPLPEPLPAPSPSRELDRWEALLDQGRAELGASLAECRSICTAAANVCLAAREICRLLGDDAAAPQHPRCQRARDACADAGQRRDGACAVCPRGH